MSLFTSLPLPVVVCRRYHTNLSLVRYRSSHLFVQKIMYNLVALILSSKNMEKYSPYRE